jgi:NitT/TauT family transport system substrate-binding protein
MQVFLGALEDAMKRIAADPADAAATWVKAENSKLSAAYVEQIIRRPENEWTMVPKKFMAYAEFMAHTGALTVKPQSWRDVFFPDIEKMPGS